MTIDVQAMKKRLMVMVAVDAVCALVAVAAAVGAFAMGLSWLQWVFVAALLAGFAVQIWFIAAFKRAKEGV